MRDFDEDVNRPKSLEDQLASVIEGADAIIIDDSNPHHAGDGVYLFAQPQDVRIRRPRRRRRRYMPAHRMHGKLTPVTLGQSDDVSNIDRVIVGFASSPRQGFRETPITIRKEEHIRSPFVISLRDMRLHRDPLEDMQDIPQDDVWNHEIESEQIPDLSIMQSLAGDLNIEEPDLGRFSEQFTIQRSEAFRPFSRISSAIRRWWYRFLRLLQAPKRRHDILPDELTKSLERGEALAIPRVATFDRFASADRQMQENEIIEDHAENGGAVLIRISLWKSVGAFIVLALIAMLPANIVRMARDIMDQKNAIAAEGSAAIGELGSLNGTDLSASEATLQRASERFRQADAILSQTNVLAVGLASVIPSTRNSYRTGKALIEVGAKSSEAAQLLAKGLGLALSSKTGGVLDRVSVLATYADGALPLLEDAADALQDVDKDSIPESEQEKLATLSDLIEDGRVAMREFIGVAELMSVAMGRDEPRRYLILFQNPTELRPTGGFIGSYAELDIYRGKITRLEIPGGGTYDLQGQLIDQVIPPEPLQLIAERWEFQDSNWSPDFPTSAQKIDHFWMKSGGYTIDGIIAVNATVVEKLLELTGPIEIKEFGKTITSENFMLETQKAVELEYDREENQPKKILGLMAPVLMERLKDLTEDQMVELLGITSEALTKKEIQMALMNEDEESLVEAFGWNGRIKPASGDALAIIGANIAGQKTNATVKERVHQTVSIATDGKITDEVTLMREHGAEKGDLFNGVRNVEYIRFYLPKGSVILSAEGFDEPAAMFFDEPREDARIDEDEEEKAKTMYEFAPGIDIWEEGARTVIGGWSMVDPGMTDELSISYRLPFSAFDLLRRVRANDSSIGSESQDRAAYNLLLTSQSGTSDRELSVEVKAPASWKIAWSRDGDQLNSAFDRDQVISLLYDIE